MPVRRFRHPVPSDPTAWSDADVELGENCELISHVVIHGPTRIGNNNRIFPFAALGTEPQDISYRGEPTRLEIGDDNVIREYVTINRGTNKGGGTTRIGSHILIMAYTHVGHDCQIGDHAMLVNAATLAGHVTVEEYAVVGALCPVHQFVRIGAHSYIGGGYDDYAGCASLLDDQCRARCACLQLQQSRTGASRLQ